MDDKGTAARKLGATKVSSSGSETAKEEIKLKFLVPAGRGATRRRFGRPLLRKSDSLVRAVDQQQTSPDC
jgi:hypothetical protein